MNGLFDFGVELLAGALLPLQPQRKVIKIGRNDPCPCGSGLKWKKCTCAKYHPEGSHTEG